MSARVFAATVLVGGFFVDIVAFARAAGYASLRLDTIRELMADAENPYQSVGFRECAAYYENPIEGAVYY